MPQIKQIIDAPRVRMGDIFLHQPLPYRGLDAVDPFLLIHHWSDTLPGGQRQQDIGVGPHPHRGFSPVTLVFKGGVHHRDTIGNDGVIYAGGTQWMNSGSGLVHSERPDAQMAQAGGDFELIQFWVNSPAARKMETPSYQPITASDTPVVALNGGRAEVAVVVGAYAGKTGPVTPTSDMLVLRVTAEAGATFELQLTPGFEALSYQLDGALIYDRKDQTAQRNMVVFDDAGGTVHIEAKERTRFIVLSGAALNEPVATYGPFVMNTQAEIIQALTDYQTGQMGELLEKF